MLSWSLHFNPIKLTLFVAFVLVSMTFCFSDKGFAAEPVNEKHELFRFSTIECEKCHTKGKADSFKGRTARPCSNYCLTCHQGHHKIDVWLKHKPRKELPLQKKKTMTCYTCHDINKKRFDHTSWKSESLFDRIFSRQESYHTYYLRINNSEGDLCKNCH